MGGGFGDGVLEVCRFGFLGVWGFGGLGVREFGGWVFGGLEVSTLLVGLGQQACQIARLIVYHLKHDLKRARY